ncbi:unnamed protein product [Lasius platythorax]|uniref:Craniofacial development protein 2-like n=1 Tax=Lasius platythorax TaxID=488582 RepID=A0AAV2MXI8_9HYME
MVYFSGHNEESTNGVALIVPQRLEKAVQGYNTINDRIVHLRLQNFMNTINIIQIYAPTTAADKAVLNDFYESLLVISLRETVLRSVPSREITIVMGDFNAKIGRTAEDDDLRRIVGKFGIGERNDRGERLLDLCMESINGRQHMPSASS